jgi:hypothetical protein
MLTRVKRRSRLSAIAIVIRCLKLAFGDLDGLPLTRWSPHSDCFRVIDAGVRGDPARRRAGWYRWPTRVGDLMNSNLMDGDVDAGCGQQKAQVSWV